MYCAPPLPPKVPEVFVSHAATSPLTALAAMIASGRLTHTTLVDGSGVVLDTDSLKVFALNETGALVFSALAQGVTDDAVIVERIVDAFEVDPETAAADLAAYLDDLHALVGGGS